MRVAKAAAAAAPAPAIDASSRRALIVVAAVALLAFVPTLHGGFVYDDHRFVEGNPHLSSPSILWRAFGDPACQTGDGTHAGLWRPLRTLSFALDRLLFGASPAGPHAVNVVLHAAGSAALAALLLAWRLPVVAAALGGLVYAVHPAQTECVAWISSRGDLIAAGCVWAALVADLRGRGALALGLGVAALLAKGEQAVVWPALIVVSRLCAGRAFGDSVRGLRGPVVAVVAFVAVRWAVLDTATQEGGLGHGAATVPVLGAVLAHQVWVTIVPAGLVFDWQMPWVTSPPGAVAAVVVGLLAAFAVRGARLPVAWFLAAIAPTWLVQAVVPLNILVADRFLLFALPALAMLVARGVAGSRARAVPAALATAVLAALTVSSLPVWASDATLWSRTADRVPGHWRANSWLGIEALREGRVDDAERFLGVAATSFPDDAKTRFHLAQAQEAIGKRDRSELRIAAALQNYRAAVAAFAGPRAEGAATLLPAARWAEADLLLLSGERDPARAAIRALLGSPPTREELDAVPAARVRQMAERVRTHLDPALADEILERFAGTPTGGSG